MDFAAFKDVKMGTRATARVNVFVTNLMTTTERASQGLPRDRRLGVLDASSGREVLASSPGLPRTEIVDSTA